MHHFLHLGTHYVQDINATSNDLAPGQIDISCEFLLNSTKTMGYMAIVYSDDDDISYLVTENQNQGVVKNNLADLSGTNYSILLYTINEKGAPLESGSRISSESINSPIITTK